MRMPILPPLAVAGLLLAGCEAVGNPLEAMANKKPSPDEFQVLARGELRRPPGLGTSTLPEPAPGMRSPLEPDPRAEAIEALTGRREAPTEPGRSAIGRGEAALLAAADAGSAAPTIRRQLAEDAVKIEDDAPFEPPSVSELLFGGDGPDPDSLVDPASEARRLQDAGVLTPVDRQALEREALAEADAAELEAEAEAEETGLRQPRFRAGAVPRDSIVADRPEGVVIIRREVLE